MVRYPGKFKTRPTLYTIIIITAKSVWQATINLGSEQSLDLLDSVPNCIYFLTGFKEQ